MILSTMYYNNRTVFLILAMFLLQCISSLKCKVPRVSCAYEYRSQLYADKHVSANEDCKVFIDNISLKHWGVFKNVDISIESKPTFAVITGETGSGKSVLISALQYICGSTAFKSKKPLLRTNDDTTSVSVTTSNEHMYSRIFKPSTKRTVCEIDSNRVASKLLNDALSKRIRFWSLDNLNIFDNNNSGIKHYIDEILDDDGVDSLKQVGVVHNKWMILSANMTRLISLQDRMSTRNEVELLTHYISEIKLLEIKLKKVFADIITILEDVSDDNSTDNSNNNNSGNAISALLSLLQECLRNSNGSNSSSSKKGAGSIHDSDMSLSLSWRALQDAETLLIDLGCIMQKVTTPQPQESVLAIKKRPSSIKGNSISSVNSASTSSGTSSTNNLGSGSGTLSPSSLLTTNNVRTIDKAQHDLISYADNLLKMQLHLKAIGIYTSTIYENMEGAQEELQQAIISIKNAQGKLASVESSLPNLDQTLSKINAVKSEMDFLGRKHEVHPSELHELKIRWTADVTAMESLIYDVPKLRNEINQQRESYISHANRLSNHRSIASKLLMDELNSILPTLDMPHKKIAIAINKPIDVNLILPQHHTTANTPASAVGSDNTGMCNLETGWDEVVFNISPSFVATNDYSTCNDEGDEVEKDDNTNQQQQQYQRHQTSNKLSSGELTRLSLALETCVLSIGYRNDNTIGMVIYDEIDAHVGGNAAVAIAKLLKVQGTKMQVLAVTHNPIFAAAADKHYVVSRDKSLSATGFSNDNTFSSKVYEVAGDARELELMRMASGDIVTSSSKEFAKELLAIDFK